MIKLRGLLLLLMVVLPAIVFATPRVDASRYDAFWVWGGWRAHAPIEQARELYILQGTVSERGGKLRFEKQGGSPYKTRAQSVYLVYRLEAVIHSPALIRTWLKHLEAWEHYGNRVTGIQLDFDARSRHLDRYAEFLETVRRALPSHYKLSVTGLLDWATTGSKEDLQALGNVVDEVVFQTYQGRHTIPNAGEYLESLSALKVPFKIGLVQHGRWEPRIELMDALEDNRHFGGYVVFLVR